MSINFKVTKEERLLKQYYLLREECFRRELGISDFDGTEDHYDRKGTVLLAVKNEQEVIAGARIFGSYPDKPQPLPIENDDLKLDKKFSALELAKNPYCQWGRFVIDRSNRSPIFARSFINRVILESFNLGFHYAFIVTDQFRSRYYRLIHSSLDIEFRTLGEEIFVSEGQFEGLEHLISYAVLKPGYCKYDNLSNVLHSNNTDFRLPSVQQTSSRVA